MSKSIKRDVDVSPGLAVVKDMDRAILTEQTPLGDAKRAAELSKAIDLAERYIMNRCTRTYEEIYIVLFHFEKIGLPRSEGERLMRRQTKDTLDSGMPILYEASGVAKVFDIVYGTKLKNLLS